MKSYDVTIQMKPLYLYLHMMLFVLESEIWKCGPNLLFVKFGSERVNSRLCGELRETEDIRRWQIARGVLLLASHAVRRAGTRVEPLRTSAWEAILLLAFAS